MRQFPITIAVAASTCFVLLIGCEKEQARQQAQAESIRTQPKTNELVPVPSSRIDPGIQPVSATTVEANEPTADWLHQPFEDATTTEVVGGLPPLKTLTGKSIGKLYLEVKRLWPTIRFRTGDGKPIHYHAVFHTTRGEIEMEFLPEVAPNHVRSFLALARAGFYDGMRFESRVGDPANPSQPRAIAAASPEGDGNELAGVGYFLRPEVLNDVEAAKRKIRHEAGMVGAVHAYQQPNAACCRFYVCLSDAPQLDGAYTLFGRITRGLAILDELHRQPVQNSPVPPPLFLEPLVIEKVVVMEKN